MGGGRWVKGRSRELVDIFCIFSPFLVRALFTIVTNKQSKKQGDEKGE